jgi:23S rRNA (guanosine2251-2'-O)-methyltransferase
MKHCIYGLHAVKALIERKPEQITELLTLKDRQDSEQARIALKAKSLGISVRVVSRADLDPYGKGHQGMVALTLREEGQSQAELMTIKDLIPYSLGKNKLILALDGITDPHNLGACLRSAEALGCDAVILPQDRSASVNATVHKTSSGASQILPLITVVNLSQSLDELKAEGFWITGFEGESDLALTDVDFTMPTILIMGNEGEGMRRLTKEKCDYLAQIPMCGQTESLNVSVACGIALYEVMRQRAL